VACGTGGHVGGLRAHYSVEGLDLDEKLLAVARRKHPDVAFHHGDMRTFDLGRRFDVVTCLGSSIGYTRTEEGMRAAIANLARHVRPGGALAVEPWFGPGVFIPGRIHMLTVDEPELKIVRMNRTEIVDGVSVLDFHYLIGTPGEIRRAEECHELGLFTHEQMTAALEDRGLRVEYDAEGLRGRGLYVEIPAA
jgi:SAM-dependent methyltransferase